MKTVTIEKKKAFEHVIGKEYKEENVARTKKDMNIYFGHIIEEINPETYDEHEEEIRDIYEMKNGQYFIDDNDFVYYVTIEDEV